MVYAKEKDPPDDMEPVDWLLLTSEPIDTDEQILEVVDIYRARWLIEEYFSALKTRSPALSGLIRAVGVISLS